MNAAVAIAGLGAATFLLLGSRKAGATTTPAVLERMTAALATANPAAIRAEAAKLRAEGYAAQAADLERAAQQLEAKAPAASSGSSAVLKRGSTGPEVSSWQTFLRGQGYTAVVVDGVFGSQTEDGTKGFQRSRGLIADGVVGPDTRRAAAQPNPAAQVKAPEPAKPPTPTLPPASMSQPAVPVLKRGSTGPEVSSWQTFLRGQGYTAVVVDGVFGSQTEDGTKGFQRSRGLIADGVVGPDTKAAAAKAPVPPAPAAKPAPAPAPAPAAAKPAPAPAPAPAAAKPAPAVPTIPAVPAGPRTLKRGLTGEDVRSWQLYLRSQGYTAVQADGVFGPVTEDSTKAWQRSRGLAVDGNVGPESLKAALASAAAPAPVKPAAAPQATVTPAKWRVLKRGSSGTDVLEWQTVLQRDGYAVGSLDGKFGPETEAKTKLWQSARKLTADGIVGAATVAALRARPPVTVRVAGDFKADSPLPGIVPEAMPPLEDGLPPDRALASRLAFHLHRSVAGSEDRALVEQFQRLLKLNPTGAYGPGTATALIRYGLVPPRPFYWPGQGSQRAKSNYRAALMREAMRDPQRRQEWSAAASRI